MLVRRISSRHCRTARYSTDMTDPTPQSRWFFPTPGRLLAVLLAVEGCLWLCGWFEWIPKGWPVVMAVAAVAAFLLLMLGWFLLALLFHWRFQYSLMSLLVLTVAVALPFAWLATEMKKAKKQRWVVERVFDSVIFDYQPRSGNGWFTGETPPGPAWLRQLLGDDMFVDVVRIDGGGVGVDDSVLEQLNGFTKLQHLDISGAYNGCRAGASLRAAQTGIPGHQLHPGHGGWSEKPQRPAPAQIAAPLRYRKRWWRAGIPQPVAPTQVTLP